MKIMKYQENSANVTESTQDEGHGNLGSQKGTGNGCSFEAGEDTTGSPGPHPGGLAQGSTRGPCAPDARPFPFLTDSCLLVLANVQENREA